MGQKLTKDEAQKLGAATIAFRDGSGYIAEMAVFHELHCIKRIKQHLSLSHYHPNMTGGEAEKEEIHIVHCLEYLRRAAMCRGDTSLATFFWQDGKPKTRNWSDHRIQSRSEAQQKEHDRSLKNLEDQITSERVFTSLTTRYAQPLLVAAYDLQQRLFELAEYPISRHNITTEEGRDDLKIYSCYLLAQYLVYAHLLRTKTGYLSFNQDSYLKDIRNLMYMIDEELDQRRDEDKLSAGYWIGTWLGNRILIGERMIVPDSRYDLNELLDGGFGLEVKGYDTFHKEWAEKFQKPMGFFCVWVDDLLDGRRTRTLGWDAAIRCLQHLLIDLIVCLDKDRSYFANDPDRRPKCKASSRGCDCKDCEGRDKDVNDTLTDRQSGRYHEYGLLSVGGKCSCNTQERRDGRTGAYVDRQSTEMIGENELHTLKGMTLHNRLQHMIFSAAISTHSPRRALGSKS